MSEQSNNWSDEIRSSRDHREIVGPADEYDANSSLQFNIMTFLGLREYHKLLDIGCGSLRVGRLLIMYLLPNHYFGIEPEQWLIENAIINELGEDLVRLKSPSFCYNNNFLFDIFNQKFDFVLSQGVFTHAPERQIRKCMTAATKYMTSKSTFVATFMQGNENYSGREWLYPQTSFYNRNRIAEMASSAGLSCIDLDWPHPHGAKWIILRK